MNLRISTLNCNLHPFSERITIKLIVNMVTPDKRDRSQASGGSNLSEGRDFGRNRSSGGSSHGNSRTNNGGGRSQSYGNREPKEMSEGRIISLLENFGFIDCADRMEDIFFHYSELFPNSIASSPEDLQVGQVVHFEFRGSYAETSGKKEKALRVEVMPEGTEVKWDIELDKLFAGAASNGRKGNVLKVAPSSLGRRENISIKSGDWSASCGVIRLCPEDVIKGGAGSGGEDLVYYKSEDQVSQGKLGEQDLVQFQLVRNRKTKCLFARNIKLLQSEKEKLTMAREARLIAGATKEKGVVLSLQNNGGYLRSTRHDLPIFFRNNHVEGEDGKNLQKGDIVEFLVVYDDMGSASTDDTEEVSRSLQKVKLLARQIRRLSDDLDAAPLAQETLAKAKMLCYSTLAKRVKGIVVTLPAFFPNVNFQALPVSDLDLRGSFGKPGVIKLYEPLDHESQGVKIQVSEVEFYPEDCPGGPRPHSDVAVPQKAQYSTWIRTGDIVNLDVVEEFFDFKTTAISRNDVASMEELQWRRFRAHPPSRDIASQNDQELTTGSHTVDWVQLNPTVRFEGVVSTIKSDLGFGFIKLLDRKVDVFFRLIATFPEHIVIAGLAQRKLQIGCLVSFDLNVPDTKSLAQQQTQQEHLRAWRIFVLEPPAKPNNSIPGLRNSGTYATYLNCFKSLVCLRKDVYAQVSKIHVNGSGMLEILYEKESGGNKQQSPVMEVDKSEEPAERVCEDASESKLDKYVVKEKLFSISAADRYKEFNNLLDDFCMSRFPLDEILFPDPLPRTETAILSHMAESRDGLVVDFVLEDETVDADTEKLSQGAAEWGMGRLRIRRIVQKGEISAEDEEVKTSQRIVKIKSSKPLVAVRFDASAIAPSKVDSQLNPCEEDIVMCDVYQSRATGQFEAMNVRLIERISNSNVSDALASLGLAPEEKIGIVCDVVNESQSGCISVVEFMNNGTESHVPEKLSFHLNDVVNNKGGSLRMRRGDEVKFKIRTVTMNNQEKRIATDITLLRSGILPKLASLKDDTAANASLLCQGKIVLIHAEFSEMKALTFATLKHRFCADGTIVRDSG